MRPINISDKEIPTADPEAVIEQYTPLLCKIAERYKPVLEKTGSVDVEDLIQAGRIAVYNAQKKYNPDGGASFLSYVFDWIRSAMRRTAGIRNGKAPEILLSLDEPLSDDSDIVRGDTIPDTAPTAEETTIEQDARQETAEAVHAAIDRMKSDKQREVITRVWIDGQDRAAAADDMKMKIGALRALDKAGRSTLRRDWQLKQFAMPMFSVSVSRFRTTWTSAVEAAVIWRDTHPGYIGGNESCLHLRK